MNDLEKLNFIADVEMSTFSQELKESLLESLDETKFTRYDTAKEAIEACLAEVNKNEKN